MRHPSLLTALTLCSGLVLAGVVGSLHGQDDAGPSPAKVAVVDVQKVFNNLDQKEDYEAEITSQAESLQKEQQRRKQEIKQLRSDLQVLSPDSDAYKKTKAKLEKKTINLKAWRKFKQRQLRSEKALRMESLYRKVVDTIEQIAKDAGYDLVLYKDRLRSLNSQTEKQMAAKIAIRKVLYADDSLNITDRVIQTMNNQYQNRSSGSSGSSGSSSSSGSSGSSE